MPPAHGAWPMPRGAAPTRRTAARGVPRQRFPRGAPRRGRARAFRIHEVGCGAHDHRARRRRRLRGARRAGATRGERLCRAGSRVLPGVAVAAILGKTRDEAPGFRSIVPQASPTKSWTRISSREPMNQNLYAVFESSFPTRGVLHLGTGQRVSLMRRPTSRALATQRLAGLGLRPGDRVGGAGGEIPQGVVLCPSGCLRARAGVPFGKQHLPRKARSRTSSRMRSPCAVIAQPRSMGWGRAPRRQAGRAACVLARRAWRGQTLREAVRAAPTRCQTVERGGDDLAAILYTSGTRGCRRARCSRAGMLASNADVLRPRMGFPAATTCWCACSRSSPRAWPLRRLCHCVLMNGSSMRFHAKFDAEACPRRFGESSTGFHGRAHALHAAPRGAGPHARDRAGMPLFVSGSAPLLAQTHVEERTAGRTPHPRALRH